MLAEVRAPFEAAALVPAAPLLLLRAPKGDGHHVVVIPPFGAGDAFTTVLRSYIDRLGYHANKWGTREILALHRLHKVAVRRLAEIADAAGGPVTLVGHSLGGIYAREAARAAPQHVRRVITIGSPFAGDLKSNVVWPMYESITGTRIKSIPAGFMEAMNEPVPVPSTAIFSKSDGVVAWQSCIDRESPDAENVEVWGSHVGLLHHPAVLWVVADRLAQPAGTVTPFDPATLTRFMARPGPWRRPRHDAGPDGGA